MEDKSNLWRARRREAGAIAQHYERMTRTLRECGIPTRYLDAELERDFPKFSTSFAEQTSYLVTGPVGTGKTHLLCAMLKERALAKYTKLDCLFVNTEVFLDNIRDSYDTRGDQTYRGRRSDEAIQQEDCWMTRVKEADILAMDDFGSEVLTPWAITKLYQVINHRYNEMLITYISTNLGLVELAQYVGERIASRLQHMYTVIDCEINYRRLPKEQV